MSSEHRQPLLTRLAERAQRFGAPVRHWLRWHSFARPLPRDWWPQFERDFGVYCGITPARSRPAEPDH